MSRIFISYRREDTGHVAGRIHDWIGRRFGDDNVFRDIDNIEPGEDFVEAIQRAISSCDGVIVLIGKEWASEHGLQRLRSPQDFVRLEISTALERNVRTIPMLVDGTDMPDDQQLPSDIQAVTRRQALRLTDASFRDDIGRLTQVLARVLGPSQTEATTPTARQESHVTPPVSARSQQPSATPASQDNDMAELVGEPAWFGSHKTLSFRGHTIEIGRPEFTSGIHIYHDGERVTSNRRFSNCHQFEINEDGENVVYEIEYREGQGKGLLGSLGVTNSRHVVKRNGRVIFSELTQ